MNTRIVEALRNDCRTFVKMGEMSNDEMERILGSLKKPKLEVKDEKIRLWKRKDVAEACQLSVKSIDRMVASGKLKPIHITGARSVRFVDSDVMTLLERSSLDELSIASGKEVQS